MKDSLGFVIFKDSQELSKDRKKVALLAVFQFHKDLCKLYLACRGITSVFISWIAPRMIVPSVSVPKKWGVFSFNFLGCGARSVRGTARACESFVVVNQNLTRPCRVRVAKWAQREMGLARWGESCSLACKRVSYGLGSGKSFLKPRTSQIRRALQIHDISLADHLSFHLMLKM